MIASSSARLAANFFTVARRFFSRLTNAVFAMATSDLERELEGGEERARFLVGLRCRGDGDVQSPQRVDLVVLDLGEDDLFLDAQVEIAAAVERARRNAAKVADARNRHRHQPVQEFVHTAAAQRHLAADRIVLADLEAGNRFLGLGYYRLLAGDPG